MTIGERIAKCRKEKNLSQEYVAEQLDVSRQAVSKWENDQTEPDTSNLIALSKLFGVSVEYLASGAAVEQRLHAEKQISVMKIIGIVSISVGMLSLVLGVLLSWLLVAVAAVFIMLGIFMITMKGRGALIACSSIALAVIVLIIQGMTNGLSIFLAISIFGGCLLAGPVFLGISFLVKKLRPRLSKKFLVISVACLSLAVAVTLGIVFGLKRGHEKGDEHETDVLTAFNLSTLPMPEDAEYEMLSSNDELWILIDFTPKSTDDELHYDYAERLLDYLKLREYDKLGTQGEIMSAEDGVNTYELLRGNKLGDYITNDVADFKFVFGNDSDDRLFVLDLVSSSGTLHVSGESFSYTSVMKLRQTGQDERYKIRDYSITFDGDESLVISMPERAIPGERVVIRTKPLVDADLHLYANGVRLECTYSGNDYTEHVMSMLSKDIVITFRIDPGKGAAPDYSIIFDGDESLIISIPESAMAGERVVIRTHTLIDAELYLYVNGVRLECTHSDFDYTEHVMIMPSQNVVITCRIVSGYPSVNPDNT